MAQKAKKDRAKSNAVALNNLHTGTAAVHALFLLFHFLVRPRSLLLWALLSAPGLVCEYVLEASGRPRYDAASGALRSSGEDLAAAGLTEYMFDVVWVTWASAVAAMVLGNWGWLLWAVVPAYGGYTAYGLLGMGRKTLAQMQGPGEDAAAAGAAAPQGNRRSRRNA
ncbi:Late endosome and vacuole interface protein 10 [Escovopsis weberi]|uniref:Late endosome and vacuole interface protein 10 n=1 Tax=Escovopsis weberi TaxID=150374 RepID=A0A0N0RTF4_ESCWE|nr:Late endosome and vacuole interface protein 10 [Escovopsis weberi]